jgi:predicted ATPase
VEAEHFFRQAFDLASRQDALSWELRVATSLARLWRDRGRYADAAALLQPVYDRFTEGFDTADLKAAKALLDALE